MNPLRALFVLLAVFAFVVVLPISAQKKKVGTKNPAAAAKNKPAGENDKKEETEKKKEEEKPKDPMSAETFEGLPLRSIGPAVTSGRVVAIAVDPNNRARYYVGAASGGVWKTDNDGTSWTPVFDHEASYSIGAVAIDPKDTNIVWVGTGEGNSQRSVSYGDGIYKSEDGGKSWKNVGLKKSEHIARIAIDPRNSDTVYVAAQGPLWGPGGDRGLYKTTDGGKTWKAVLTISENTGVTDVAIDPDDPGVIYAAAYQRRRHVWTLIDGGPESAIYKSTDAGATWTKLKSGLPSVDMGRIGLAISPADHNVVYAIVEAADKKGGIFRSKDRGATWEKRNDFDQTAMYYAQIIADPKSVDRVYVMNVFIMVSDDGGKTLHRLGEHWKHVDNHVMWIDPNDTDYYLVGCDGGVYESRDRGANWEFKANLPLAQFYDVAVDNAKPFYGVFGGTQDNNSLGGPSRTPSASGIINADWFITAGGDGFRSQVDPDDPNTIYAESQYGGLIRYDRRTGQMLGIQPVEPRDGKPYRWNWDSPIIVSPWSHTRLYFGANVLFRSDDRGNSWRAISPDLTRQIDRDTLPVMGRLWGPDAVAKNASTSFYGNIVALSESPKKEGLIYAGTDDGLIQVTEDGGAHWTKLEKFPGVPDRTYVSRLAASWHDVGTVYASFDNHKNEDFRPYLLKSTDMGKSWSSIVGNLPENGPVLAIAEDPVESNLLFVGTEFGAWFSIDSSKKWIQLKGDFPTIAVRDAVIQQREGDLVLASFGRGFYILDDITPLRTLKADTLQEGSVLFPIKDTLMYLEKYPLGGLKKSFQGESFYTANNPPFGALITYYLKDGLKTKQEKRQEEEKTAVKKGLAFQYPSPEELRTEAEEEKPAIFLTIYGPDGKALRRISGPISAGIHRVNWDLRYPAPVLPGESPSTGDEDLPSVSDQGPMVMPGQYKVKLSQRVDGVWTDLAGPVPCKVYVEGGEGMSPQDEAALYAFQQKVARMYGAVHGAIATAKDAKDRLAKLKIALRMTPSAPQELFATADKLQQENDAILRALQGDRILAARDYNVPISISDRLENVMEDERFSVVQPTKTDVDSYTAAGQEFTDELGKLRTLVETDLANLEKQAQTAGAPWIPGIIPQWQEQ